MTKRYRRRRQYSRSKEAKALFAEIWEAVNAPKLDKDGFKVDRLAYLFKKYGVTKEEYVALIQLQGDACAVCKCSSDYGPDDAWVLDHDHATGEPRGLLCPTCNSLLGLAYDNPKIMLEAISYLANPPLRKIRANATLSELCKTPVTAS